MMKQLLLITFAGFITGGIVGCGRKPPKTVAHSTPLSVHPVFRTQITGQSVRRPAIQVDLLDVSESWFGDAELYLAVQSSRFPDQAWVLFPINVGNFDGCRSRFIQLPFEVSPGDNLLFNLLDDDELTDEDEQHIVAGCRVAGYCVLIAGSVYVPKMNRLIAPVTEEVSEILGRSVISGMSMSKFDNYGREVFIVPPELPSQPNEANKLALLDDSHYARVQLRIYGPPTSLDGITPNITLGNGNLTQTQVLR